MINVFFPINPDNFSLWSDRSLGKGTGVFVVPHLLCRVDVDALVELILKHRHHGVVPGDSVDSRVLQTHVLYQTAADLHDQRDELRWTQTEFIKHIKPSVVVLLLHSGMTDDIEAYLVIYTWLTILQPHTESFRPGLLCLLHDVDSPRRLWRAALI